MLTAIKSTAKCAMSPPCYVVVHVCAYALQQPLSLWNECCLYKVYTNCPLLQVLPGSWHLGLPCKGHGDCCYSSPPRCAFRSPSRRSGSLGGMVSSTSSTCCQASHTGRCRVGGMYVLNKCSAYPPSVAITVWMYSSINEVASNCTCHGIKVANPPPSRFSHATCST